MATTMTLSELMTATRQRADMLPASYTPSLNGNTNLFVTDSELISYINQSYFELYDLLVSRYGDNYFVKNPAYTFTTDGTSSQYALPTDFYKLLGVDLQLSNTPDSYVTLRPFEFVERNRYAVPNFQSFYGVTNMRYRLNGNYLWLTPIAAAGQGVQVWYVPRMATLAALVDTADGISGWTEYIIVDAAMKCLVKEESDVSAVMAMKTALIQRIESMAEGRDAGSPPKVSDNQASDYWWPTGSGTGGY